MKYKKVLFLICIVIFVFGIASACAGDADEAKISSEVQNSDITQIENQEEISSANVKEPLTESETPSSGETNPTPVSTKITVKNVKGYENKKVMLTATVKDSNGKKIKKGTVVFKFRGKEYKVKVKNGKAKKTIKIPKTNNRGTYYKYKNGKVTEKYDDAEYKGNASFLAQGNYLASSSAFKVTSVKKSKTKKYTPTHMSEGSGETTKKKPKKSKFKTFKSKSGYKWKIKKSKWNKMKKQAKKNYKKMKKVGSALPGYSKFVKVTVTKGGHKYHGIAAAIKNDYYIRCQVRGAITGLYISSRGADQIV